MTKYNNLAELVGKGNFLDKKDLSKLVGAKINLRSINGSLEKAIVYTENNYDFALVYKSKNNAHFTYISLNPELLGNQIVGPKNNLVLAKPEGYAFVHKGSTKGSFPIFCSSYSSIEESFEKVYGDILPKLTFEKMPLNGIHSVSSEFSSEYFIRSTKIPYSNPYFVNAIAESKKHLDNSKINLIKTHSKIPLTPKTVRENYVRNREVLYGRDVSLNGEDLMPSDFEGAVFRSPFQSFFDFFKPKK